MKEMQNITRVVIVHGWADDPTKGWMRWLTDQLLVLGMEVIAPAMPDPKQPNVDAWLDALSVAVGTVDQHTALVGHSLGTYVLLRYLSAYSKDGRLGKLVLVAGFAGNERTEQGKRALPDVDLGKVKASVDQIYSVYSDNDEIIPAAWSKELGESLDAENVLDSGKGHFAGLHGCDTLPSVLKLIRA